MPLYQVALVKKPTPAELKEGGTDTLILEPVAVIADNDKSAAIKAVAQNSTVIGDTDLGRVEVLVVPFA